MILGLRHKSVIITLLVLVAGFPLIIIPTVESDLSDPASLTSHNTIYINGNSQFTSANGVIRGVGTKANPFIIENWSIDATGNHGIRIENTNAHFVIRNCHIYNGTNQSNSHDAIYLDNVDNGALKDNRLISNDCGIYLYESDFNTIFNNTCLNNGAGIVLRRYSDNNTITNNTCLGNGSGIGVNWYSNDNLISNNTCNNHNNNGISIYYHSNRNIISNNQCNSNMGSGIYVRRECNYLVLTNNTCNLNNNSGIYVWLYCRYLVITNNTFNLNIDHGMFIRHECNYFTITNNICSFNYRYGIYIWYDSNNNKIYNNFFNNNNNSIDRDNTGNVWYRSKKLGTNIVGGPYLGGNFWSDYGGADSNADGLGDTNLPYGPGDNYPLVDIFPPKIEDNTTGTPTTGDPFNLSAIAQDNFIVQDVYAYWDDDGAPSNLSMNRINGDETNGDYTKMINVSSSAVKLHYSFSVRDRSNNWKATPIVILDVVDNDKPEIIDQTQSLPTTGDDFSINVTATDNIKVESVQVKYWFDDGPYKNTTFFSQLTNYNTTISVPTDARNLSYIISAVDNSNNWASLGCRILDVNDNDAPFITDLSGTPTTGDDYTFEFKISDNIELSSNYLEYWFDDNPNINIIIPPEQKYFITVPPDSFQLHAIVTGKDTSNNIAQLVISKPIIDNDSPHITDLTDKAPETGRSFIIKCVVSENRIIRNVKIEFWFDGGNHTFSNMSLNDGLFNYFVEVPNNASLIYYIITAEDMNNNSAQIENSLNVIDEIPPEIFDLTNGTPTTGDKFEIKLEAVDNIEVSDTYISYWFDNDINVYKTNNNSQAINIPTNAMVLHYILQAVDTNNNNASIGANLTIKDNDEPLIDDMSQEIATTGEPFILLANIVDNIQLLEVNIEISLDLEYFEEIWKPDESGYNKTVLVPNSTKLFSYRISAIDTASNQQIYYRTLIVEDNDKPSIIDHSYNSGQIYELRVEATDNVDIETVNVDYWFESTDVETLTLEINDGFYQGSIHIPEGTEKLYYAIFAVDTSKNWERTKEKEVELLEPELEHKPEDKPSSSTTTLEEMAYWILLMIIIIIIIILIVFQWISKRKKRSEPDRKPEPILPKIETVTVKPTTSITKHTKESISISTPEIPANSTSLTVTLTQAQAPTPQQIPQPIPVPQLPPAKGQGQTDIQAQPKPIISITPTGPTTPTMDPISQIGSLKNNNQDVAK